MATSTVIAAALAYAAFASALALPSGSLPASAPSSTYAAPSSASIALYEVPSSSASASPVSSEISPSVSETAYISASSPPLESAIPSYSPSTTTADTTSTTATLPAPTPTESYTVNMEIGTSSFPIGDADISSFQGLWAGVCGPNGCDGGTPADFTFNFVEDGMLEHDQPGNFTLTGTVDNDQDTTNGLLTAINAALGKTQSCTTDSNVQNCAYSGSKRAVGPVAGNTCDFEDVTQCTIVNYISATLYDSEKNIQATIELKGGSDPQTFDCEDVLGGISDVVEQLDLPEIFGKAVGWGEAFCGAAGLR